MTLNQFDTEKAQKIYELLKQSCPELDDKVLEFGYGYISIINLIHYIRNGTSQGLIDSAVAAKNIIKLCLDIDVLPKRSY